MGAEEQHPALQAEAYGSSCRSSSETILGQCIAGSLLGLMGLLLGIRPMLSGSLTPAAAPVRPSHCARAGGDERLEQPEPLLHVGILPALRIPLDADEKRVSTVIASMRPSAARLAFIPEAISRR